MRQKSTNRARRSIWPKVLVLFVALSLLLSYSVVWAEEPAGGPPESSLAQTNDGQPGDGQPGDEQPGEEQPGDEQPGEEQPGDEQPGEEQPGDGQPGDGQPGDGQPGDEQPGEEQPGDEQPGEEQPGDEQPGEEQPGDEQPPADEQPGDEQPGDEEQPSADKQQPPVEPANGSIEVIDANPGSSFALYSADELKITELTGSAKFENLVPTDYLVLETTSDNIKKLYIAHVEAGSSCILCQTDAIVDQRQ